jgi:type II secretory pathway pseudopilin PulG
MDRMNIDFHAYTGTTKQNSEEGFTLTEFLIASLILLVVTSAVFTLLFQIQSTASYQAEVQSVLNNSRIAMQTVERYIRQAGNDPLASGLPGITIVSATELRIRSDLTGSSGTGNPDKGDPDGDIDDPGENITIRYNNRSRSLEIVPEGGPPQIVAGYISGLSFQYYDANGRIADSGSEVRKIAVIVSGSTLQRNPQTRQIFGITLSSEVRVLT